MSFFSHLKYMGSDFLFFKLEFFFLGKQVIDPIRCVTVDKTRVGIANV